VKERKTKFHVNDSVRAQFSAINFCIALQLHIEKKTEQSGKFKSFRGAFEYCVEINLK
jgi:hypothetical protein